MNMFVSNDNVRRPWDIGLDQQAFRFGALSRGLDERRSRLARNETSRLYRGIAADRGRVLLWCAFTHWEDAAKVVVEWLSGFL